VVVRPLYLLLVVDVCPVDRRLLLAVFLFGCSGLKITISLAVGVLFGAARLL
jgi:hypothetical protein